MRWSEVRSEHENRWLVVEVLSAWTVDGRREAEDVAVLDAFDDSVAALRRYLALQLFARGRELYVAHTGSEKLAIAEKAAQD